LEYWFRHLAVGLPGPVLFGSGHGQDGAVETALLVGRPRSAGDHIGNLGRKTLDDLASAVGHCGAERDSREAEQRRRP